MTGIGRLRKRADFVNARRGRRIDRSALTLQAVARPAADAAEPARLGLTVTKKTGGAVVRNRIRRRLREAVRTTADIPFRPGFDYVILARAEALTEAFARLQHVIREAVETAHAPRSARPHRASPRPSP